MQMLDTGVAPNRPPGMPVALAFAGIYLIWGTTYLAIAVSIQTLPPFTSGAVRFLTAAALMYGWLRWQKRTPFIGIDWRRAALCGVLLTGFGNGLVVWAQQGVPSGIAALLVAAIPIFILAVECMFFGGRLPAPRAGLGMLIASVGVVIIVVQTSTLTGNAQPIYIAAILLAVLCWSFGTLFQRQANIAADRVIAFTCAQIFFGALAQLTLALANREWQLLEPAQISTASVFALLYLVVFGSIVALSCYSWLLTQVAPQKVATYALVNPVVALLLGAAVLHESVTAGTLVAALAVLIGIGLVLFPNRRVVPWRVRPA
jgi:drug/metabolite transporter (DMT)-like permease